MDFQSLVERKLTPTGVSGSETIYPCPYCEDIDTGHHLYVNYDKSKWHCFKCGAGGKRIESLLRVLHIDVDYDYSKLYDERDAVLDDIISPKKKIVSDKVVEYSTDLSILTEYYNLHTTQLSESAYNYLFSRGMSIDTINKLQMREGISRYGEIINIKGREYIGRDYSGRIMVPSLRRDGTISFYVGRDYVGGKDAKYLNCPKELGSASEDVWNIDMIYSDSVIICEGVFSAIASSPIKLNAVATYGKSIAHKANSDMRVTSQGEKLLNKKFKNYYVCYDADAHDEAIKTCEYLYDRGANVYIVLIDPVKYGAKSDVNDIGYDEFMKLMTKAIHYKGRLSVL